MMFRAPQPVADRRGRRRVPLRARAALGFGLTALLLSVVLATVAYTLVRRSLLDERVQAATRQAYTNARVVRAGLRTSDTDITRLLSGLRVGPDGDGLVRVGGEWYASSVGTSPSLIPVALRQGVEAGHAGWQRFGTPDGTSLAVGVPIAEAGGSYYEITSLTDVNRSLDVLGSSLAVAAVVAAAIGAALGVSLGGTVLRPLRRMARVSQRIVHGELDQRLDAEGDRDLVPLVASFNEMLDDLRARIEREARFASDVTHEIRSPLTALAAAVEVVNRRKDELPDRAVQAVEVLEQQVRTFNQLVLDLLEISRFDAGTAELDVRSIDLGRFFDALLRQRGEHVEVRVAPDAREVRADTRRLQQMTANLLDNARNYAGGAVALLTERVDGAVRIVVEDAGPGVGPEERAKIFERFARGSAGTASGAPRGTGLGLALVAEHARLHRGRVWVEDRPGGGSRFVIELPGDVE